MNPRHTHRPGLVCTLAWLTVTLAGWTAAYAQVVVLPSDWPVGQAMKLEKIRTTQQFVGDLKRPETKTSTQITLAVLAKDDSGYLLRWTIGSTVYLDPINASNPFATSLANLMQGIVLDIRTDQRGMPQGLENPTQAIAQINQVMRKIAEYLQSQGATEESIQKTLTSIKPLTDPKTLGPIVLTEPAMFCKMLGMTLVPNEPVRTKGQTKNPLGPPPLPAEIQYVLTRVDPATHHAVIEWRKVLDGQGAADVLQDMYQQWAELAGKPPPRPQDIPRLKIEESTTYVMDTRSGWPHTVSQQQIILTGKNRSVEQVTFKVLPDR